MKNILLFTPKYPPSRGGAATFYSNLTETQSSEHKFIIITRVHENRDFVDQQGRTPVYSVLPRNEGLNRYIRALIEVIVLMFLSSYLIIFKNIDAMHAHASSFSVIGLAIIGTTFRVPILKDCRDEGFRGWMIKRGPTPIWFSCASNIDRVLVENGVPVDRIVRLSVVNPNHVKNHRRSGIPHNADEIVFIGTVEKAKGIFLLVEAFEFIRNSRKEMELTIIGDGPDRSKLQKQCQMKGLNNSITFTGPLGHRETLNRLAESDVLVLPSESEGVPRVVLEGQEVGTPVVATAIGGIPDVIDHEENGMLAEQTAESVAENVLRLVRDDELYRTVVQNGVESAEERGWERVGEQLHQGYTRALGGKTQMS
jgi:glycosyltransferase involved in cell wall biosynthesis